jgi:hypothetical protein
MLRQRLQRLRDLFLFEVNIFVNIDWLVYGILNIFQLYRGGQFY